MAKQKKSKNLLTNQGRAALKPVQTCSAMTRETLIATLEYLERAARDPDLIFFLRSDWERARLERVWEELQRRGLFGVAVNDSPLQKLMAWRTMAMLEDFGKKPSRRRILTYLLPPSSVGNPPTYGIALHSTEFPAVELTRRFAMVGQPATTGALPAMPRQFCIVDGVGWDESTRSNSGLSPSARHFTKACSAWVQHVHESIEPTVTGNGDPVPHPDSTTPNAKLPSMEKHDRQAWQLSLMQGMTQSKIAETLNKEHGTSYNQGQVSKMIGRVTRHADASGLSDMISAASPRRLRVVDPAKLDLGQRTDGRRPQNDRSSDSEES